MTHRTRNFNEMIQANADQGKFLCLGLDPDISRIPTNMHYKSMADTYYFFCKEVVDCTHTFVAAYKPNTAFFEGLGWRGVRALERLVKYIHRIAPRVIVIIDAKRADIGNTNKGYVSMAFTHNLGDALTVNPLFGAVAMKPFLQVKDKGIIILCHTSNDGAEEFQDLMVRIPSREHRLISKERRKIDPDFKLPRSIPNYQYVAYRVSTVWNKNGNCAVVVGATYPEQTAEVRKIIGDDVLILAPGVGTQGADVKATVTAAKNSQGRGFLINSSSALLYASGPDTFLPTLVKSATSDLDSEIRLFL